MFPAYGTSNPWRSRSQPPPVQRRAARGAQAAASGPSATASSNPSLPRKAPKQGGPGSIPAQKAPEPVDERTQRLQELDRLAARFAQLERDFSPPRPGQLAFQPRATPSAPKLEYNSTNAPVHAYEEGLTRLLTELDGVESGGDVEVRSRRKALASRVEGEAQRVETWRREVFEAKQAGKDGPEWQKAAHDDVGDAIQPASSSSQSVPPVASNSAAAISAEISNTDAQLDQARPSAQDDEAEEPETPVDEVVYHAHEAPASGTGPNDNESHRRLNRSRHPAAATSVDLPPAVPSAQKSRHNIPMCQAEDGDEEEPWTSADERELRTRSPRARVPSAPSQARPRVSNDEEASIRQRSSQAGSSHARSPERQQQPSARRAPLDPFEALFGSGSLGGRGDYEQRTQPQRGPSGRREVPNRYATYGEDEDNYDPAAGGEYVLDPRTGNYYPRSRVPWYAHGYPRERDLGGYGPAGGSRGGGEVRGGGGPYYARNGGQGQRGSGYFTPESDYSYRRGASPFGGFGW